MMMTTLARTSVASPSAGRVGYAFGSENPAFAEIQATLLAARQFPRSEDDAVRRMISACSRRSLALKAFWRLDTGAGVITGESVYLARELARCWGNLRYGVDELARDTEAGHSTVQAWAWDLEANDRVGTTFIAPHLYDANHGTLPLTEVRDVYASNANAGARRLREQLFAVLPTWFVEMAKEECLKTLAVGPDGESDRPTRRLQAITAFEALGVTVEQLEDKLRRKADDWSDLDLAQLEVVEVALGRGEITIDQEFPPSRVTIEEITGGVPVRADGLDSNGFGFVEAFADGDLGTDAPGWDVEPAVHDPMANRQ